MESPVADFYFGKCIFVTGGTGLMGKVLLEKLLYSCPGLDKIYVLLRSKRGKGADSRLEDIIKLPLFGRIRRECPHQLNKLVAISGDVAVENLGLSQQDEARLINETNIVVHGAASLKLDAKLKDAINMNTEGTLRVLELSKKMKNLDVVLHLSTAFCHGDIDVMEEKVYKPPHDPKDIIRLTHWLDDATLEKIAPDLLQPHPNTYTYSKRIAEALVDSYSSELPVCIIRPSIVTPAWRDPLEGWVDNLNGPVGIMVGGGKGVIRSMHCNGEYNAEVIPVDMAISGIIAIARDVALHKDKFQSTPVYNLTQSGTHPITWGEVLERGKICAWKNPFEWMLWYPNGNIYKSKAVHKMNVIFFHWLPAYFIDFLLFIFAQKTFMLKVQKKIQDGLEVLQYFTTRQWQFSNDNILRMRESLSQNDKEVFNLDFERVEVDPYLTSCILGARQYLLKEDLKSLPRCRRNLAVLWFLDKLVSVLFYAFLIWMVINFSEATKSILDTVVDQFSSLPFLRTISHKSA
ncbi:putative fatty acyl-CoA reductase CG5065 [Cimex lectularius]|uniref:Fatty acyl-CoA reductase n=1 Tax=Cimex lectularius TaxID=79782 RepID=A0A8I6SHN7_CIMLE|nr:putative fatty acyl-CoA reductase CG5065 [Cimex lectularius]